jgi:hypothetical protein
MIQRRIVMFTTAVALIVLGAGAGPSLAQPAAAPSASASELSGNWRGWFNIVGGDADRQGDLTLEIKDDATYTMIWNRKGAASNESGRVISANGSRVSLRNASGQQMTLVRNGNTLYGLSNYGAGGHPIQVTLRRAADSDAPASTLPRFDRNVGESEAAPAPIPLQTP